MLIDNKEIPLEAIEAGAIRLDFAHFTLSLGRRLQHQEIIRAAGLEGSIALLPLTDPGAYVAHLGESFRTHVSAPSSGEKNPDSLGAVLREKGRLRKYEKALQINHRTAEERVAAYQRFLQFEEDQILWS